MNTPLYADKKFQEKFTHKDANAVKSAITELDGNISNINTLNLWIPKNAVATKAALVTTYAAPAKNWAAMVLADGYVYINDGLGALEANWVNSGQKAFPVDIILKKPGKNLLNPNNINAGNYIYYEGTYGEDASGSYFSTKPILIDSHGLHTNKPHAGEAPFICHIYYNSLGQPIGHTKLQSVPFIEGASYVRFCYLNEKLDGLMIEKGLVETEFVPYSEIGGYEATLNQTDAKKLNDTQKVAAEFEDVLVFDNYSNLIQSTDKYKSQYVDISGVGCAFNKVGISFNAIRIGGGKDGSVSGRKWAFVQAFVKNDKADVGYIAKTAIIPIDSTLAEQPEILLPLMDSNLNNFITLNDASFSGDNYFIGFIWYNSNMSFAYGGAGFGNMSNYVDGSSCYTTSNSDVDWYPIASNKSLTFEHVIIENPSIKKYLTYLRTIESQKDSIEISLPDKINAIVGDTLQLFFRGMIKAVNPYNYDIVINCAKGQMYPRYFEYTPTSGDIGTTNFNIKVKNNSGKVLATKTCTLITKAAVQAPATLNNGLFIGDSLTHARIYMVEAFRRLTQSGGTPAGLSYSNINFVGRKAASYGIGVEGNGGWSWGDYLTVGRRAFTFAITAPTIMPAIEAVYKDANNKSYTMWWDYSTISIKMLVNDMVSTPPTTGTLTKISGIGDETITYSSTVQSSGNPFWNDATGELDFTAYVNKWCGGSLDVVYTLLTWNGQYGNRTDFSSFTYYARTLFNHIKTAYPNIKIKLLGVQIADLKQGMRVDGSPAENTYTDQYGLVVTALNMNKAYQDLANEVELSGFVEFVNISSQVDSEYNMPYTAKAVNTRNSITEEVGTNDVHPGENGYDQIGDVVFRNYVSNFCQ